MGFYKNLAYEASAGSGKTFALVVRYISLLYLDAKPNSILALTFTNKAANEMRDRVGKVLKELDKPNRSAELKEISKTLDKSPDEIIKKREEIYKRFLQSELKISTIDKFFTQILRKFSLNLGLMPDFIIENNPPKETLIEKFLTKTKEKNIYKDLVRFATIESKKLSDIFQVLEDFYTKDGEIETINHHIKSNIDNEKKILELVNSIKYKFLLCETLSLSAKKALDADSIEELLTKSWITKDSLMNYRYFKKCFTPDIDELFKELKDEIKLYFLSKESYLKKSYLELYKIYKESKKSEKIAKNQLSFNDITNSLFELLCTNIDSDFLYFRLDSKIDHILIDEFQDTNIMQFKILEPILNEISSGIGTKEFKTLFYVGDIKQSIYRFRGGAKELFHYTKELYDVTLKALTTNYRSSEHIVLFVNKIFKPIITGYQDQLYLKELKKGYLKIKDDEELLENVSQNLFSLLSSGIEPDKIAILTHQNSDAYLIEEELLKRDKNLKITTQTTSKLINSSSVLAIIELLKYLYFGDRLYYANFLAIINKDFNKRLNLDNLNKNQDLLVLVKEIIDRFKLYNNDPSLLKFIEVILDYKDIDSLLFEVDELNIEAPSKKSEGVKILTIHKSKGLEFNHVIVADRFKRRSSNRSSLIFYYKKTLLKDIFIRTKNREYFDEIYADALEREKRLSDEDHINLLYVAFTRAKESLIVCKNKKDSSFDILGELKSCEVGSLDSNQKIEEKPKRLKLEYE